MKNLLEGIDALTEQFERGLADAVLEVSVRANPKIAEEAAREAAETAIRMVKAGRLSVEEIKEFFPKLSPEQIKQIGKRLSGD